MSVYGYARVSSDGQEANTSLPTQRDRIAAYATARALAAPTIVEEVASGADSKRPLLAQLRAKLAPGDSLIILRLDRLYRSVVDGAQFFEEMRARKVAIRSVSEQLDTSTPMGELMLHMVLAFAQAERRLIAERMAAGKARTAHDGEWNGGPCPYGYRRTPEGPDDFAIDPAEGEIVRRLFKLYSGGNHGAARLRKVTGCSLSEAAITCLLGNPFYRGLVRFKGTVRANRHVPLVSAQLWCRVQRVRAQRAQLSPSANRQAEVG